MTPEGAKGWRERTAREVTKNSLPAAERISPRDEVRSVRNTAHNRAMRLHHDTRSQTSTVIILKRVKISNHYVTHLKITCYQVNPTSVK